MTGTIDYAQLPTTAYAGPVSDNAGKDTNDSRGFMDHGIKALWAECPPIAGPAFTVKVPAGDNLMLHAAIYQAPAGSVIVVDSSGSEFAVAGGNVCAVAKQRGIAGFVIDGVVRDIGEIREMNFPLFARGVVPVPGIKQTVLPLNQPIVCGGTEVSAGDIIVADEDGIVVLPQLRAAECYQHALAAEQKEQRQSLAQWQAEHRAKIEQLLAK